MSSSCDFSRLQATLGVPELARLVDALRLRLERGRPLSGSVLLTRVSESERAAIDALVGRPGTRGRSVQVDLTAFAEMLRDAGISEDLRGAVEALVGPVVDRRATSEGRAAAWHTCWSEAETHFAALPALQPWLKELAASGLLRRLCGNDAAQAGILLRELARLMSALPANGEPRAVFATRLCGDAHALDPGTPLATLAVRASARLAVVPFRDQAEDIRASWASVGVICDEMSTPALVLNLPSRAETPLGQLLRAACAAAEPLHVSLRLLLRFPLARDPALVGRTVFVCENPAIVALAVAQLGSRCASLVCVNGQFATPTLILLRQLRDAGAELRYHGDFDPAGLVIARRVIKEAQALPWRFGAADYLAAPKGVKFTGSAGATPCDETLRIAMNRMGRVVHEEATFPTLATDLAGGSQSLTKLPPLRRPEAREA